MLIPSYLVNPCIFLVALIRNVLPTKEITTRIRWSRFIKVVNRKTYLPLPIERENPHDTRLRLYIDWVYLVTIEITNQLPNQSLTETL